MLFVDDSLEKCRKIMEVRKLKQRKYMDVCLPSSVDESSGYHMDCYCRFTTLLKPDREYLATLNKEQKKFSSTKTRSSIGASFIATNRGFLSSNAFFARERIRNSKEQNKP